MSTSSQVGAIFDRNCDARLGDNEHCLTSPNPYYQARMKEHRFLRLTTQLARVPFLAHIDQTKIEELMVKSPILEGAPGEILLQEGDDEHHFLLLLKGTVEILKDGEVVATLDTTGEILGEQALLKRKRSATVRAKGRVFCMKVDGEFVDTLTEQQRLVYQAELYRFLAEVLAKRLDSTSRRLAKIEHRLAESNGGPDN